MAGPEDYEQIAKLIDTAAPEKIPGLLQKREGGIDDALEVVFGMYERSFIAERAEGVRANVQFDLGTPEGTKSYVMSVADGACRVSAGSMDEPTATLALDMTDFLHMTTGQSNGAILAMTGRIRVGGDMMTAMALREWFVTA